MGRLVLAHNDLTKNLKMDLAEFGDLVGRETSNKLDNVTKEMQDEFKEFSSKIEEAMKRDQRDGGKNTYTYGDKDH